MCSTPKIKTSADYKVENEVIKNATQADASTQKANFINRVGSKGLINQNIRTTNTGIEDDIITSKKKLLGE